MRMHVVINYTLRTYTITYDVSSDMGYIAQCGNTGEALANLCV